MSSLQNRSAFSFDLLDGTFTSVVEPRRFSLLLSFSLLLKPRSVLEDAFLLIFGKLIPV